MMPSSSRKPDLVSRLQQEVGNRPLSGESSVKTRKVMEKKVGRSQKVWLVETIRRYERDCRNNAETERKLVGIYSNKTNAIEYAKVAISDMDMSDSERDDTRDEIAQVMGRHGGLLCEFEHEEGGEMSVSVRRANFNKPVKKFRGYKDEEDCSSDDEGGKCYSASRRYCTCDDVDV
eukprot:GFUD01010950.1.p1 GENE.GFUD01010950.1~~GFUD01010950.1.p1  ORF type:complete len:176 (+),score=40.03 GFUD01010950.1:125-652(+)